MDSLEKNNFKKCPIISGFNKDEGTLTIIVSVIGTPNYNPSKAPYISKEKFETEITNLLTFNSIYRNGIIDDSIKQEYIDWATADDPEADYFDPWNYLAGDVLFACPMSLELRAHAKAGDYDAYQYYFTHVPTRGASTSGYYGPQWLGAAHTEELSFVFGTPFDPLTSFTFSEDEMKLSENMMRHWSNFAKTGYVDLVIHLCVFRIQQFVV